MPQPTNWRRTFGFFVIEHYDILLYAMIPLGLLTGVATTIATIAILTFAALATIIPFYVHVQNKIQNYIPKDHRDCAKTNPNHPGNDVTLFAGVVAPIVLYLGTSWITKLAFWLWSHLYWK